MRGKRILFFEPDAATCRTAERALNATGSEVDICQDVAGALESITVGGYELYILNCDPPMREDRRLFEALEKLAKAGGRVVLMTSTATEDYLPLFKEFKFVRNLVARNAAPLEPEELIVTAGKLLRKDIFGLGKYLMWGVEPYTVQLRSSAKKAEYMREVTRYAEGLGCNPRMTDLIDTISDELITNAIFNAPRKPDGTSKYGHLPRRETVDLEDHEVATLSFACDGDYLALSSTDPFGALSQETVVSYLNRCMVKGPEQMSEASGGGGLGLHRIFQSLSKFVVNIQPGKKTEVIALVDLRLSIRQFRQATKSFHIFTI
jgi:hypothetical protein